MELLGRLLAKGQRAAEPPGEEGRSARRVCGTEGAARTTSDLPIAQDRPESPPLAPRPGLGDTPEGRPQDGTGGLRGRRDLAW
eukprot:2502622-Lingulodinium_polyedra.AAC.1